MASLRWALMGNHYHLVVKTGTVPLWRSMLRLQSDVARAFNKRHGYLGRLWQSRYRARVIDSQDYFRNPSRMFISIPSRPDRY